ncbi:unnamed protein product [Clavelina lepadiformis]|uniref:Uncharacterized protein n=1 Tax=Clavelina lepadiformis TaxID=159417 RepID=A0ABP0GQP1_CLALP
MNNTAGNASAGDKDAQLDCYGIVFPDNCTSYYGPHSPDCLKEIWEEKGCVKEGHKFADNLTSGENATLTSMNLRLLVCKPALTEKFKQNLLNKTAREIQRVLEAFKGNASQAYEGVYKEVCFGMEFITFPNVTKAPELLFSINATNYNDADRWCRDNDAVLATVDHT